VVDRGQVSIHGARIAVKPTAAVLDMFACSIKFSGLKGAVVKGVLVGCCGRSGGEGIRCRRSGW
jgi:hypothetical protein